MATYKVGIARYEEQDGAVRRAVELSGAFDRISSSSRIFIKPNIVVWSDRVSFPKWGVITTTRVIEEIVALLAERGVSDITIGEGIISVDPKEKKGSALSAYQKTGYSRLAERYGVKLADVLEGPFEKRAGDGISLNLFKPAVEADFIISAPPLKTHAQTVVSLGMKNLKGLLDIASRKKCHNPDITFNLNHIIPRVVEMLPPVITVIDGIYSLERGPAPDGRARRTNLIIASGDALSAEMAGARALGHGPEAVPYIAAALCRAGRPADFSDIDVLGERLEDVSSFHQWDLPYSDNDTVHKRMKELGITGITHQKYDDTMCTYCSVVDGAMLTSMFFALKPGDWGDVDILTGKRMRPLPGKKKTILVGQCMCNLNRNDPSINELIMVDGCPPDPVEAGMALQKAGIPVQLAIFQNLEPGLSFFLGKYRDKPEFQESFYLPAD